MPTELHYQCRPIPRITDRPVQRQERVYHKHPKGPSQPIRTQSRYSQCPCGNTAASDGYCRQCRRKAIKEAKKLWRNAYVDRNKVLREMGHKTYAEYLSSDLWQSIRDRVLVAGARCVKCKGAPTQVHHSRYTVDNLAGTSLEHLHPVCGNCHHQAEFNKKGKKIGLNKANKNLGIYIKPDL